jgi:uncharacterized protein (TIGR03118 family)
MAIPSLAAASARHGPYRPVVECLEDRWLMSSGFLQIDLASNLPGLAPVTDTNLINPWGMSFSPTGPFWFADNGRGVSDLLDGRGQPEPLVVALPSPADWSSTPTGTVFYGGTGFVIAKNGIAAPSRFLFAAEDGSISGWTTVVDPTRALVAVDNASTGAVYKGLAIATDGAGRSYLYAADFSHGTIDVFDQDFKAVLRSSAFADPNLPAGYAPFNIQNLDGRLFVTYAQTDAARHDDVPGAGHGFIDEYSTDGTLLHRFASQGALNSPWGLALAPTDFGRFAGDLLVGNNGDGRIGAYNSWTGAFLGDLTTSGSNPIAIDGLWGLSFGNGHAGGDSSTLFFTAGLNAEQDGLFGAIQAPGRVGADTGGTGGFDPTAAGEPLDYPLPPSSGPAFVSRNDLRSGVFVDLLPLSESSLALVPTLTTLAPTGTRVDGASLSPAGLAQGGPLVLAESPGVRFAVIDGYSPPRSADAGGAGGAGGALNAFLDIGGPQTRWTIATVTNRGAGAVVIANAADREGNRLVSAAQVGVDQDTASPSTQADDATAAAGQAANVPRAIATRVAGWVELANLLLVVGFPMTWAFWVRHRTSIERADQHPTLASTRARRA